MRLCPPNYMNGLQNSFNGNEIPATQGSNANLAQALQDCLGGVLGGGASAGQGASGGGTTGGSGSGARAPGPGPNGGGGAGGGASGGADGGQGTPGGRSQPGSCGVDTDPPAPDRDDNKNRSNSRDHLNGGTNGGNNGAETGNMPGDENNPCTGGGDKDVKGCPPCDVRKLLDLLLNLLGG